MNLKDRANDLLDDRLKRIIAGHDYRIGEVVRQAEQVIKDLLAENERLKLEIGWAGHRDDHT